MTGNRYRQITGIILVLTPLPLIIAYVMLQTSFEYPGILDQTTVYALNRVAGLGGVFVTGWYLLALAAILFILDAALLHRVLALEAVPYLVAATAIGIAAGVFHLIGIVFWPFLVPFLASTYIDPAATEGMQSAIDVVYRSMVTYADGGIRQFLGHLFTAGWTALAAFAILRSAWFRRWLGWLGLFLALLILLGVLAPFGIAFAGALAVAAYIVWSLWLALLGLSLLGVGPFGQRRAAVVETGETGSAQRAPRPAAPQKKPRQRRRR